MRATSAPAPLSKAASAHPPHVPRLIRCTQLPEPIVREIATGTSRIAHRYDNVTVLQADMVGFTPLSAARGPEEVLGILSELFADFDQAAERWGVHKVKTIGDAYIVCCGAFVCTDDQQEAARRIVNMAVSSARGSSSIVSYEGDEKHDMTLRRL